MDSGTKTKKRVLINARLLQQPYTGIQSYVHNLIKSLVKEASNIEFHIIVLSYKRDNEFIEDLLSYSNVFLINVRGLRNSIYEIFFDIFIINRYIKNFDLYFSPVNILPYFKNRKVPHIVGVLDLCTFIVPETTTRFLKTYYDIYLGTSLKRADKIIPISENTKRDLLKLFHIDKSLIRAIHLGIDDEFSNIKISPRESANFLESLGLHLNDRYFLSIGTSKRKNIETTIEAFSKFVKTHNSTKLVIVVNDKGMIDHINICVDKFKIGKENIILTQRYLTQKELKILYNHALCLVYCSYYEGFGLPVLESMQCNCPVITSNVSSLPEISGDAALLVNPYSAEEIYYSMLLLYNNPSVRTEYIRKGVLNTRKYSWTITAKSFVRLFNEVMI